VDALITVMTDNAINVYEIH